MDDVWKFTFLKSKKLKNKWRGATEGRVTWDWRLIFLSVHESPACQFNDLAVLIFKLGGPHLLIALKIVNKCMIIGNIG